MVARSFLAFDSSGSSPYDNFVSLLVEDDFAITDQGAAVVIGVLANDVDVDAITVTAVTNGADGTTTVNQDGTINFTPNMDVTGDVQIEYAVTDGAGGTGLAVLTVSITPNIALFLQELVSFEVDENQSFVGQLLHFDLEGDPVTRSIAGGSDAALFDIDAQTGELTFVRAPDFENPLDVGAMTTIS